MVDFSKINVPTAMFVADEDELGDLTDASYTRQKMQKNVMKHFEVIHGGHMTFMVGRDVSYLKNMLSLVDQYSK